MTPEIAGQYCDDLDKRLRGSEVNLTGLADMIVVVLRDEAWRRRRIRTGEIVECASFLEFLTAPPLKGCGEDVTKVEKLLKDDAEALRMFREATTRPRGGRRVNGDIRTIEPERGTTRAYTLDRLHRTDPALYQRVVKGELSANAAAIQAGLRKHKTALDQLHHWWTKATATERRAFRQEIGEKR